MEEEDAHDDATASPVVQRQTRAIEAKSELTQTAPGEVLLDAYLRELSPDLAAYVRDLHHFLVTSETMEQLDKAAAEFKQAADEHKLGERIKKEMRLAYSLRKGEITSG